jgi:hypothetical protein
MRDELGQATRLQRAGSLLEHSNQVSISKPSLRIMIVRRLESFFKA